jgi:hypothetical protein
MITGLCSWRASGSESRLFSREARSFFERLRLETINWLSPCLSKSASTSYQLRQFLFEPGSQRGNCPLQINHELSFRTESSE